ncbi:hypothetical protein ASG48_03720 [Aurantimonas sp. Leaf443]|nr:hypothetical protein ASG48_03720 [Aurantimonas sp. Leaf443]
MAHAPSQDKAGSTAEPAREPRPSRRERAFVAAGGAVPGEMDATRTAILTAAAEAFRERGFALASIDDVARRLGATKGLVYHYYRTKTDLFFDVALSGMALCFTAVEPHARAKERAATRLCRMSIAHLQTMLEHVAYQHVILQGVARPMTTAVKGGEAAALARLTQERDRYEALFRGVLAEAAKEGDVTLSGTPSFANRTLLSVLNSPVAWYRPRAGEGEAERGRLVRDTARFALRGVGTPDDILEEELTR